MAVHAALAIAWSGNLLVLFIFYEVLTFPTYPLVIHKQTAEAMRAGRLYMGILVGTSLMLLLPGVIWVWTSTGSLDFVPGGILAGKIDPSYVPWLLALFAFGIEICSHAYSSLVTGGYGNTDSCIGLASCRGGGQGGWCVYHADGCCLYLWL